MIIKKTAQLAVLKLIVLSYTDFHKAELAWRRTNQLCNVSRIIQVAQGPVMNLKIKEDNVFLVPPPLLLLGALFPFWPSVCQVKAPQA